MSPLSRNPSPARRQGSVASKLFGLIALTAAGVLAYVNYGIAEDARAPEALEATQVRDAPGLNALPSRTVRINATKVIDTGVRRTKSMASGGPGVELKYLLVQVQDRFLIAEVREYAPNSNSVTGRLAPWTDNPHQEVIAEVRGKVPGSRDKLLSFHLNGDVEPEVLSFYLWIFAGFFGLVGLVALFGGLEERVVPPNSGLDLKGSP